MPKKVNESIRDNQRRIAHGQAVVTLYAKRCGDVDEAKYNYTVADVICDLLHFAQSKGWDADDLIRCAKNHFFEEQLVSCAKCGRQVAREHAVTSMGTGPEAGRQFYYCSEDCERRH